MYRMILSARCLGSISHYPQVPAGILEVELSCTGYMKKHGSRMLGGKNSLVTHCLHALFMALRYFEWVDGN